MVSISAIYPQDCKVDWKQGWLQAMGLTVAVHPLRRVSYILLAQEKTKIQSTVSTECISLSHHHKVANQVLSVVWESLKSTETLDNIEDGNGIFKLFWIDTTEHIKSLIIDKNNKKQNLKGTTNQEKSLQNSNLSELK